VVGSLQKRSDVLRGNIRDSDLEYIERKKVMRRKRCKEGRIYLQKKRRVKRFN